MFAIEKCDEISVNDDRRRFFPKQQRDYAVEDVKAAFVKTI